MKGKELKKGPDNRSLSNDNVYDNLSGAQVRILSLLKTPRRVADLAHALKRKAPNICRDLKKLANKDLVTKEDGSYRLSNYALSVLCYQGPDGYLGKIIPSTNEPAEKVRLHNLSFTLDFWEIPEGWDRSRGIMFGLGLPDDHYNYPGDLAGAADRWKDNQKFPGGLQSIHLGSFTVICSGRGVRVYVPNIIRDDPADAAIESWRSLLNFLPRLERWLKLPATALYSHGRLNVRISSIHMAIFHSIFAEYVIEEKGIKRFVIPADDGKERIIVDHSDGFELEPVHKDHAIDDAEVLKEMIRQFADQEAPLPKVTAQAVDMLGAQVEDINRSLAGFQSELLPTISDFAKNIKAHTGTAKANLEAAQTLNRALDRMDKILDLKSDKATASASDLEAIKRARRNYLGKR